MQLLASSLMPCNATIDSLFGPELYQAFVSGRVTLEEAEGIFKERAYAETRPAVRRA